MIDTGAPAPVYLFGPFRAPGARIPSFEPVLAERAIERLVARFVEPSMKDLVYGSFYADEADAADIVLEAQTLPFLAERRVILVRNAEHYSSESAAGPMLAYVQKPCDTTILMLVSSQVDKRTKFYKACEASGVIVECPALNEREVVEWVRAAVGALGKTIGYGAVQELIGRAGTHLSDVENAIHVVAGYVGDAPTISDEDVVAACADVAEEEIWALTDAIAASETSDALRALHKLLDLGKHEDEIMGTINWLLKSAYAVAVANKGQPSVSSFVARKVEPLARKLGVSKLRDAFALCTDTHFMLRTTSVDSTLALELLVVKLSAPRRQPTPGVAAPA
ncbi:MAG TPA: DNA polymerase III subunit delta [Candidatus Hydrogenedentes bacterium]|nr:DNA polymerase III subunit delta [Candidatus Hydrogenedentota bacterium]HPG65734.1 DNA polymerase III subunit delta [Candidatus Hydrogenedentota bacterium]